MRNAAALLAVLCALACGGDAAPSESVQIADSAGIRTVRFSRLDRIDAPAFSTSLLYRTNSERVPLYQVQDGLFLDDGSLLLANAGSSQLLLLDAKGAESRRIGRKGQGPGEFQSPTWLHQDAATVWAYDRGLLRLTQLDSEWSVIATRPAHSGDPLIDLKPLTMAADGSLIGIYGQSRYFKAGGERRDTTPLLRVPAEGTVDTLGLWPGEEIAFASISRSRLRVPIGFARTVVASGRDGMIAIGATDQLAVELLDGQGGRPLVLVGSDPPDPVDAEAAAAFHTRLQERLPRGAREMPGVAEALGVAPVRETVPPLGGVEIDAAGRIWIAEYARPDRDERRWVAFDREGRAVGRVDLPIPAAGYFSRYEVLDIGRDRIALLLLDEYDTEYVEVWRLER